METGTPEAQTQVAPMGRSKAPEADIGAPMPASETGEQPSQPIKNRVPTSTRLPSIIVGVLIAALAGLSFWYLLRPQPLLVQGEVDATRFDIAARKAALERAEASVVLAQKTYDRVSQLAEHGNAPIARLDQATDSLHEAQRAMDQAKSAYEQAVNGYTKEEHEIAAANVKKAIADIAAVQSIIDQMVIYAPVASQVYQRNVEPGEYVSPGVPLVTLIDLNDMWIHFDLREDLVKTLKVGDRFDVRIPALADRRITVEVKLIATKGEYASWRATRATGDFDLRTFSIRAYPVDKVPELRPGMSAYLDWRTRR